MRRYKPLHTCQRQVTTNNEILDWDFPSLPRVSHVSITSGPFKCYVTQMGVGGCQIFQKKAYDGVMFNVISVKRGWVGVQFAEK